MREEAPPPKDLAPVLEKLLRIGFGLGGVISLATGAWMLAGPAHWFEVFPGAIEDFGPLNLHFVRDLGGWYAAGGVLFLFALTNPLRFGGIALVVWLVAAGAHAVTHVWEVVSGRVGGEHWIIDAPFVYAPLVVLGVLLWVWWSLQTQLHPERPSRAAGDEEQPELFAE